jgi:hypothetical protein
MSVVSWIWVASFAGALLFAAAGYFAAAKKPTQRGRNRDLEVEHASEREGERERDALRALIARTEERAESARLAAVETASKLARAEEDAARSRSNLDNQKTKVSQLERELLTLQQAKGQTTRMQQDLVKCERDLAEARARVTDGASRAAVDKAKSTKRITDLDARFARVTRELESLTEKERRTSDLVAEARAEAQRLASQLSDTRGRVDALTTEADSLRREAALVLERTVAEKKTLEAVRDENAALRLNSAELADLKQQCAALRDDNARLRAAGFAAHAEERARRSSPTPAEYTDMRSRQLLDNASLQQFVDEAVKTPSVSAAALTDELGFLVAGVGDHTEALAAFGAYLTDAGARACGLLPMHSVQRVSIQDDSGITLTAHTIVSAPNELVLVTLGVDKDHMQHERHESERPS